MITETALGQLESIAAFEPDVAVTILDAFDMIREGSSTQQRLCNGVSLVDSDAETRESTFRIARIHRYLVVADGDSVLIAII